MERADTQTPETVATRLREQFAPSYLTLTSIIQGVALSTLVIRIEGTFEHFDTADWLLAAATLLAFLLVWHESLMQALAYVWMPTLLDSAVPFAFLVAQLFLAHLVYGGQRAWLLAGTLAFAVGILAYAVRRTQTYRNSRDNSGVVQAIRDYAALRFTLSIAPILLFFGAWALYDVLDLGRARVFVAAGALVVVVAAIAGTVPYWQRVLSYARNERADA